MMAENAAISLNQNSGSMGAFANAVYKAGCGTGTLSSVIINTDADFVMKLGCSTDGFNGSCMVLD